MKIEFSTRRFWLAVLCTAFLSLLVQQQVNAQVSPEAELAFQRANMSVTRQGTEPVQFNLPLLSGGNTTLAAHRGQVVILYFWTSWCHACVSTMPSLEALHLRFRNQGLEILAINVGEDPSAVRHFISSTRYTFPVLLDRDHHVASQYGVRGVPGFFIIDRSGRLISSFVGGRNWDSPEHIAAIDALLRSP